MAITINGTSGVTFPDGTVQAVASNVTSVLGATGAVGTGGITAGTTYTVWTDRPGGSTNANTFFQSDAATYPDWRNVNHDVNLVYDLNTTLTFIYSNSLISPQLSLIMFSAGTYRLFFGQSNSGAAISGTIRVLVDGVQQYSVSSSGTTIQNRSVDLTVSPFSVVTIQSIRTTATGAARISSVRVQTANGGLVKIRGNA